jgi:hypothetical protein
MGYPRALRQPGSVWDRLPASVRATRWWYAAFAALLPLPVIRWIPGDAPIEAVTREALAAVAAVLLPWLALNAWARADLRRRGLAGGDLQRVAFGVPPSQVAFWSRPHIEAVLAPAPSAGGARVEGPDAWLQSVLRHAAQLSGPVRPLGPKAVEAARQVLASIEAADREVAELARAVEAGEAERLEGRIAALRQDEQAPLRALLEQQLALVRGLSARLEEAQARRNRYAELLKTLSLHLAALRSQQPDAPAEASHPSEGVRALCDEIARQTAALAETATAAPVVERPGASRSG